MALLKFKNLVKSIPPFKDYGPGSYRQGTEMNGKFFGYDLNVRIGTFWNSGRILPYQTQVADYDQVMVFIGANTYDLGILGALVDFYIGEEKDKHRITIATAFLIPKGLPYGPITIGQIRSRR